MSYGYVINVVKGYVNGVVHRNSYFSYDHGSAASILTPSIPILQLSMHWHIHLLKSNV